MKKSAILLAVLLCSPSAVEAQSFKRLSPRTQTFSARVDIQGFFDGFERLVENDTFAAYGESVTLGRKGKRLTYRVGDGTTVTLKSFPTVITLGRGRDKRAVLLNRHGARTTWAAHWGALFKIGRQSFLMLDANANGTLWEKGKDAIVVPGARVAAPYSGQIWTETGGWEIKTVKGKLGYAPLSMPPVGAGWQILNAVRQRAGSLPVSWDEKMAGACLSHVKYCIRHSWRNHYQEEGKAGYSEAGDDAAKESVLGFAYGSTREAMLEQIATAYHMAACINPEVERSGMAIEGTVFACNVMGATERELPTGRVKFVWPPHGATDVQRGFNNTGELPMPIPGSESDYRMKIGQVIMARVDGEGPYALKVTTPRGAAIEGTLTTPSNGVDNPGIDENNGLVILAPHSALPANTLLTATLTIGSGKDQVVRVWRFKTGSLLVRVSHRGRGRRRRR